MNNRVIAALTALLLGACATAPEPSPVAAPLPPDAEEAPVAPASLEASSASYDAALEALGDIAPGQYVAQNCASAAIPDEAYAGFDVKRCTYEKGGLFGVVYVLNPSSADVARWIANACASVGKPDDAACAQRLARRMNISNSFIFPVAGDVIEPASSTGEDCAGRHGDIEVHNYFRDGVTIETERGYTCETDAIPEADADVEAFKTPAVVFNVGRIAALHRNDYTRLMNIARPSGDEWRAIVRDSYLDALRTGNYSLLNLVARKIEES